MLLSSWHFITVIWFLLQIIDVLHSVVPNLDLQEMTSYSSTEKMSAFIQNNIQVFRKGVIPFVQDFLAGKNHAPDENINALDNLPQRSVDLQPEFGSPSERGVASDEEARRHINLAKAFQSEQFRTSQDRYDLAAIGTDAVISPSLSSDSDLSVPARRHEKRESYDNSGSDDIREEGRAFDNESFDFAHAFTGAKAYSSDKAGAGDGDSVNAMLVAREAAAPGGGFVDNLVDFGFESSDAGVLAPENPPKNDINSDLVDVLAAGGGDLLFMSNTMGITKEGSCADNSSTDLKSGLDMKSSEGTFIDQFSTRSDDMTMGNVLDDPGENHLEEDVLQSHSPFNFLFPHSVDGPVDFSNMPSSSQASGQASKISSYPETPPNSCMEPSDVGLFKETQLPSFNSSEMVRRIHEKKAALAGHSGNQIKSDVLEDEENLEGLFVGAENGSGGGGSLISPAVPQNSYVDLASGFDFSSSGQQIPKLMNSDIMDRVNEKLSQFEWSIESLEGSTSGVDVGPNSDESVQKSPFGIDGVQHIAVDAAVEPQVPYTPQNSFVEENFDTYARNSLPSLNSAEIVAKIKAKQSAMFGNGTSARVSRSSHGSDESGGCRSPDVTGRSLDSPQAPYTPQNSYRDNLGILDTQNHLPDLNEVAERLSTESAAKRNFGKRSTSNSGGGSRDEENINMNVLQQSQLHYVRTSSSQSDSQNTMSDVESLMSVSTDIGTPSENIVATGIASQMRNEIALLSRKDTNDSDVFPSNKAEEFASGEGDFMQPKVNSIDLVTSEKISSGSNIVTQADRTSIESFDEVVKNEHAGAKELFSPVDNSKVRSVEDHALFEVAESIVAQSVAAAVQVSQREAEAKEWRSGGRLRWNDNVQSDLIDSNDNFSSSEFSRRVSGDGSDDDSNVDENTAGGISESLHGHDVEKLVDQDSDQLENTSDNVVLPTFSVSSQALSSVPHSQQWYEPVDHVEDDSEDKQRSPQYHENSVMQNDSHIHSEPDLSAADYSHQILGEQNITELALNELAFELAHELIQSALEDFPINHAVTDISAVDTEAGANDTGKEKVYQGVDDIHDSATKVGQENTLALEVKENDTAEFNVSGNNENMNSAEIPMIKGEGDFDVAGSTDPDSAEEILIRNTGSNVEKELIWSGKILESKNYSGSSLDSNSSSSSSERKRSREMDTSMTIIEDEIMTTFPERGMSIDMKTQDAEEDIVHSFPGRKFSKSEDFPPRRFSRDENTSRRSSRLEESDLDVIIGPEDIETDYLPNMDPLQGNLDIIDASFSKITDADREVVEGESFRKVSGQEFVSGSDREEEEEEERDDEEGYKRMTEEHGDDTEGSLVGSAEGLLDKEDFGSESSQEESEVTDSSLFEKIRDESQVEAVDLSLLKTMDVSAEI